MSGPKHGYSLRMFIEFRESHEVSAGAISDGGQVYPGAELHVYGSVQYPVIVDAGGILVVHPGGKVSDVLVTEGGQFEVMMGGKVTGSVMGDAVGIASLSLPSLTPEERKETQAVEAMFTVGYIVDRTSQGMESTAIAELVARRVSSPSVLDQALEIHTSPEIEAVIRAARIYVSEDSDGRFRDS
jgi:hypothetical protein